MVCLVTMLLFHSTLMSLAPIRVVHCGTDPMGLPYTIIVLVCTVSMEMTFLALLFYIVTYVLHRSTYYILLHRTTVYTNVTSEAQRVQLVLKELQKSEKMVLSLQSESSVWGHCYYFAVLSFHWSQSEWSILGQMPLVLPAWGHSLGGTVFGYSTGIP